MGEIPKIEQCAPGIDAVGFRVLVAVQPTEEVTKGGIILSTQTTDKDRLVQTRGRIVSMGSVAFDFARFPEGTQPQVGDAVMFAKLAGYMFDGADGREYRLIHDQDVSAIIQEDAA